MPLEIPAIIVRVCHYWLRLWNLWRLPRKQDGTSQSQAQQCWSAYLNTFWAFDPLCLRSLSCWFATQHPMAFNPTWESGYHHIGIESHRTQVHRNTLNCLISLVFDGLSQNTNRAKCLHHLSYAVSLFLCRSHTAEKNIWAKLQAEQKIKTHINMNNLTKEWVLFSFPKPRRDEAFVSHYSFLSNSSENTTPLPTPATSELYLILHS